MEANLCHVQRARLGSCKIGHATSLEHRSSAKHKNQQLHCLLEGPARRSTETNQSSIEFWLGNADRYLDALDPP